MNPAISHRRPRAADAARSHEEETRGPNRCHGSKQTRATATHQPTIVVENELEVYQVLSQTDQELA